MIRSLPFVALIAGLVACDERAPASPPPSEVVAPMPHEATATTTATDTTENCDDETLSRRATFRSFFVDAPMVFPMGETAYPNAERLATALADDVPPEVVERALSRFDEVAAVEHRNVIARYMSFLGVQLALSRQQLRCFTTEALRASPRPTAESPFDDLSHPEWLRPGQSFFVGTYHGAPVTVFWDGERPTFLPDLAP